MVSREIDKRIQKRVLSCLEMEWSHNKATVIFRGNILSGMPDHLKDDIQIDMCANVLRHVKLFEDVPENFITTLATHVKITLVPAKEIVIYAGTVNQEMYIVLNGFCEVRL
ncbi:hypothetical protein C0J52_12941 [Blattella germanica]|nr:hypothetical protein C0J52_12941 [Blattella germanica]